MQDRMVSDLNEVGLSEAEAKTYLALLDHYKVSAKELSGITGIFRTQMYDVLKSLISKGFCTEVLDKVKIYIPVDPELALKGLIDEFERKGKLAGNLSRQLHQMFLANEHNNSSNDKMIEVLRSTSAVKKRLKLYLKSTQKVILSFNKPPYQLRFGADKKDMVICDNMVSKEIIHNSIFQIDNRNPRNSLNIARQFEDQGETVRMARFLPMKMLIIDNIKVFYQLSADESLTRSDTATFIQHPEITLALINSFWVEWNRSLTIEEFIKEYRL